MRPRVTACSAPGPSQSPVLPPLPHTQSVTRQHLNSEPIELRPFFFFFLQVNEISCLLGKTLTLLVKETQWLAKSTHRSRKRSPTLRHV